VLYFYPRDQTPGCTVEAQGFRDAAEQFRAAGVEVVGVSTDDNTAHQAFATHENLGFALISDPDGRLAASFGVGVRLGFAQRITFVINKMGNVVKVFSSVTPAGHAAEVLAVARQS
jgi:peroxiredoxin Q/BCP